MRACIKLAAMISLVALCGCASKERLCENIYEGLKKREQVVHPATEPVPDQQPGYDAYQREREKALQESTGDADSGS